MQNTKRVTRKDVAKLAGVSTGTVSYALNGTREISDETRAKVNKAVDELKYKPDIIARSMKKNETLQLGIIVNNIANPYYGEIIHSFESAALENGYFVNICSGEKNLEGYFDNFIARRLDGIYCMASPFHYRMEKIYELIGAGIKVVIGGSASDTAIDLKKMSMVDLEYSNAMHHAVDYLYGLGHREIALLSGIYIKKQPEYRIRGYLSAVRAHNLASGEDLLFSVELTDTTGYIDGYKLAAKLMASGKHFTAVVCVNDLMAMGAIKAFIEKGYSIPGDISVMGFDNAPLTEIWNPSITTMAAPKAQLGAKAFELLYTNIKKGNTGYFPFEFELLERESTGVAR